MTNLDNVEDIVGISSFWGTKILAGAQDHLSRPQDLGLICMFPAESHQGAVKLLSWHAVIPSFFILSNMFIHNLKSAQSHSFIKHTVFLEEFDIIRRAQNSAPDNVQLH